MKDTNISVLYILYILEIVWKLHIVCKKEKYHP